MAIRVENSNLIATELLATAGSAVGGALSSSILGLSIGAAGGAIFGLSSYAVGKTVQWVCAKTFNLEDPAANTAARIVSFIIGFFASVGAGMLAATLMGFPITFATAVILSIATFIIPTAIAAIIILTCHCCMGRPDDDYIMNNQV